MAAAPAARRRHRPGGRPRPRRPGGVVEAERRRRSQQEARQHQQRCDGHASSERDASRALFRPEGRTHQQPRAGSSDHGAQAIHEDIAEAGVAAGNPVLRNLDRRREQGADQRHLEYGAPRQAEQEAQRREQRQIAHDVRKTSGAGRRASSGGGAQGQHEHQQEPSNAERSEEPQALLGIPAGRCVRSVLEHAAWLPSLVQLTDGRHLRRYGGSTRVREGWPPPTLLA